MSVVIHVRSYPRPATFKVQCRAPIRRGSRGRGALFSELRAVNTSFRFVFRASESTSDHRRYTREKFNYQYAQHQSDHHPAAGELATATPFCFSHIVERHVSKSFTHSLSLCHQATCCIRPLGCTCPPCPGSVVGSVVGSVGYSTKSRGSPPAVKAADGGGGLAPLMALMATDDH